MLGGVPKQYLFIDAEVHVTCCALLDRCACVCNRLGYKKSSKDFGQPRAKVVQARYGK